MSCCVPISIQLHLVRKRTVYTVYILYILYIYCILYTVYCILYIYCTVSTHAPFRMCHEDSEKTVLDELGKQHAKHTKNAKILKEVNMVIDKLIQESGESYS